MPGRVNITSLAVGHLSYRLASLLPVDTVRTAARTEGKGCSSGGWDCIKRSKARSRRCACTRGSTRSAVCTVLVFKQEFTLEDAVGIHAFVPLDALPCVRSNSMHVGGVSHAAANINCAATLKVKVVGLDEGVGGVGAGKKVQHHLFSTQPLVCQ